MNLGRFSTPVIALSCLAGLSVGAHAATARHAGLYNNIRYIEEADDYVGARIDVRPGPNPTVEFELCEGWCNGSEVFPAKIDGDRITFTYLSRWVSSDGGEGAHSISMTGRFVRRGLWLRIGDAPPELLRRGEQAVP
jgi:hypothetical protein